MSAPRIVALIPARGGSKRIARKNLRELAGHPLIHYTIAAAKASGIFSGIFVSTEDAEIKAAVAGLGVCVIDRPPEMAADSSPDIDWVTHALDETWCLDQKPDAFAILRPTSPLRNGTTIKIAWQHFLDFPGQIDSLRAVELVRQHPCKMWESSDAGMIEPYCNCFLLGCEPSLPHHSRPTQTLPMVYVQNASLEIAHVRTVTEKRSISGDRIMPFHTIGWEGFDLNTEIDWLFAEMLIEKGLAVLPEVS